MKKLFLGIFSAVLFSVDLYTKYLTESALRLGESVSVIPGFFDIHYARNTGGAWSMLDGGWMQPIFLIISLAVSVYAIYTFVKEDNNLILLSITFILAGNFGNFYDRLKFKYVRDMLSFNIFGYDYPIFNFADVCLVIGFGILFLYIYLEERKEKHHGKN